MKNIIIVILFLYSLNSISQEAGRAGEFLKNEVQTDQNNSARGSENRNSNDKNRRPSQIKNPNTRSTSDFRWNNNYGNSEVFLRIPENGRFRVEIGDQMMSNSSGKFRFFDLGAGNFPISIYENDFLIYRTRLHLNRNSRIVLDFFTDYGIYLLGNYPLPPKPYGVNEWDDIWNNPYQGQNNNWDQGYYNNIMTDLEFKNLITTLKQNTSFDKDKIIMISSISRNLNFTSKQILELLNTMSFEQNKLESAKELYQACIDKRNFYIVYDAFKFEQNKRILSEYVLQH